jgi:hypothetical protein
MSCYWIGADQPRMMLSRHEGDCAGEPCRGCLPCTEFAHCRVCGRNHAEQTCADCLNDVRSDLAEIVRLCDDLPIEAEIKGIDSEAANLAGPAADWETWHHVKASVRVGRLPEGWQETADHELHPLFVLGGWDAMVRDALEHDEPNERVTITLAAAYVDRQLTYLAGYVDLPFEDLARDLRQCRAHIERVLHDGEQRDTGAPCMTCRVPLERVWGSDGAEDGWRCPRCREFRTEADYRHNIAQQMHLTRTERVAGAEWLNGSDMEFLFGVKAATVHKRFQRGDIKSKWHSGERVYRVSDMPEAASSRPPCYPVQEGAQEVPNPDAASHQAAAFVFPEESREA